MVELTMDPLAYVRTALSVERLDPSKAPKCPRFVGVV